ncbi:MAG TPA: choice-of-anchor tandem repeat GloVer-containing protein [Candidatus Binatia bacterium]|nr:choice-of-anchor tandem repeat GloVer-containing protein [Candidatus Binatia bacterium]
MDNITRHVLGIAAATVLLSACSTTLNAAPGGSGPVPNALSPRIRTLSQYHVLYNFHGPDGSGPIASLTAVNGTLYGTTKEGGTHGLSPKNGVVFSLTTDGKERVLHDFRVMALDGTYPMAGLIEVNGTLYGTTGLGNPYNTGTVYSITTSGEERLLYSFGEFSPAGMQPSASVTNLNGMLYGTTNFGGDRAAGTIFSLNVDGTEKIVHSFGHPFRSDGQIPGSSLIAVNGTLYGTTYEGGIYDRGHNCGSTPCPGDGTIFSVTSAGKVRVLHSFGKGSDGLSPEAGLIDVKGMLYGTTAQGGTHGCGTVFSVSAAGAERVLHSFGANSSGGCQPAPALIDVGGTLYGTTAYGGAYNHHGTVFSITTGGVEHVLHSFGSGSDGKYPEAALLDLHGTLYGTTEAGGTAGHGTVFAMTP